MTAAKVSIILLAAGLSSRMQAGHKLLLPLGRHTMIEEVLTQLQATSAFEWIVVTGHDQKKLIPILSNFHRLKQVSNPHYQNGLTSSIQQGIRNTSPASEGYMLCLSDLPFITSREYQYLLDAFSSRDSSQPCIVRAVFKGSYGHPVIFSRHFKAAILEHRNPQGCREIIKKNIHSVVEIDIATDAILKDVDTNEDYQRLILPLNEVSST